MNEDIRIAMNVQYRKKNVRLGPLITLEDDPLPPDCGAFQTMSFMLYDCILYMRLDKKESYSRY